MRAVLVADVSSEARAAVQSSFARQTCVMEERDRFEARRYGSRVSKGDDDGAVVVAAAAAAVRGGGEGGGWIREEEVEEAIGWEDEDCCSLALGLLVFFGFLSFISHLVGGDDISAYLSMLRSSEDRIGLLELVVRELAAET